MNRFVALFSELDPEAAGAALHDLRFSNSDVAWITGVLARWRAIEGELRGTLLDVDRQSGIPSAGRPTESYASTLAGPEQQPSAATVRRWVGATGRMRVRAVLRLAAARFGAERRAGREAPSERAVGTLYRLALRTAFRDPVEIGDLAVDGDDLRAAGIPPGPLLGRVLALLLEDVLEEPARNRSEWLVQRARELYSRLQR
jgi:hypothetical protein